MRTGRDIKVVRAMLLAMGLSPLVCAGASVVQAAQQQPAAAPPAAQPQEPAAPTPPAPVPSGRELFHEKGCEYCHGVDLGGTEKGPALTGVGRKLTPGQIQHQIHDGGGSMPAFGDTLSGEEEASLVKFLSTLKARPSRKGKAKSPGGV